MIQFRVVCALQPTVSRQKPLLPSGSVAQAECDTWEMVTELPRSQGKAGSPRPLRADPVEAVSRAGSGASTASLSLHMTELRPREVKCTPG